MSIKPPFSLSRTPFFAAVSGTLMTLSFPDTNASLLAWVALVPLLTSLQDHTSGAAFRAGMIMGAVHFSSLLYWIVPTLHQYGHLPLVLALPALMLLVFYLCLYTGLFCALISMGRTPGTRHPILIAMIWVALEYLRAGLLTGFPWGLAGYTQYRSALLIQISDITGVYGVSFLVVLVNAVLARALSWWRLPRQERRQQDRPLLITAIMTAAILLGCLGYGHQRLTGITSAAGISPHSMITVIQGNIPQSDKWDERYVSDTIATYCRLSRTAAAERPDLIVWPETALPFYYSWDETPSQQVDRCIEQTGTWFLVGSPAFTALGQNRFQYYNRAFLVDPAGRTTGFYDKNHLVPFGEYVPLGRFLPFLDRLTQGAGDFAPGPASPPPMAFHGGRLGGLICFEQIFPASASRRVQTGADLLVTITNDAWFGRTSAPLQHFSTGVFRAVENRRALVRSANTGISGFISPAGRIMASTPLFEESVLTRSLPRLKMTTVYTAHGDLFALCCLILGSLLVGTGLLKRIKTR